MWHPRADNRSTADRIHGQRQGSFDGRLRKLKLISSDSSATGSAPAMTPGCRSPAQPAQSRKHIVSTLRLDPCHRLVRTVRHSHGSQGTVAGSIALPLSDEITPAPALRKMHIARLPPPYYAASHRITEPARSSPSCAIPSFAFNEMIVMRRCMLAHSARATGSPSCFSVSASRGRMWPSPMNL
ncbi:hypothetical protein C8T65DRAFT_164739 [Cerioporus squamosus]|nr:hypothetical protein C8T65DRAFT_164739 [Cerioporus squamosus]